MELINEKNLENICGGKSIEDRIESAAKKAIFFGKFIAVCAIAKLTSDCMKNKKAKKQLEPEQIPAAKIIHIDKTTYYYYNR